MAEHDSSTDAGALWTSVSAELRASLPAATYELWIEPLRVAGSGPDALYLTGSTQVRAWVERRYREPMERALARIEGAPTAVVFVDPPVLVKEGEPARPLLSFASLERDPDHTFERFVIGPGSRLAHAAALAVAEAPGEAYNPLFIHGPPGLGKTHLLGAISAYISAHRPELTVHTTTAERFTTEFVTALRTEGPERFKRRYRALDALLIDDIQVLEGKPRTEEEFVHTFNALFAAGKQIVLSSDRPPGSLSRLEERLRDRFAWGLTVDIEPPDLQTRVALLWRFATDAVDGLPEPEVLRDLASRVPGNARLLEGALTRVLALSSILGEPVATPIVRKAFPEGQAESPGPKVGEVGVQRIQEAVSAVLGVPRAELLSAKRTPKVAGARQLAMYLTRELTSLSLAQIAREFDRDHSTVMHAIKAVTARNQTGSGVAGDIHRVRDALG